MKNRFLAVCLGTMLTVSALPTDAYHQSTHVLLSAHAARQSNLLSDAALLADLGLGPWSSAAYTTSTGISGLNVEQMISFGGDFEDTDFRYLNHFFDPQFVGAGGVRGRGLDVDLIRYRPSPDWALEDQSEVTSITGSAQLFSYREAQRHLFAALTGTTANDRRQATSLTFQTIGQVIHHLQDMGQPQHTRNDIHLPVTEAGFYERYTREEVNGRIPAILEANPYPIPTFPTVREFWYTPGPGLQRRGMAEFTAQNYVSYGSEFQRSQDAAGNDVILPHPQFPQPDGNGAFMRTESVAVNYPDGRNVIGPVDFAIGPVSDHMPGRATQLRRLAAASLVDVYLGELGYVQWKIFTENTAVFEDNYGILLPRVVAFSAGLLNHFFRGRLGLQRSGTSADWLITNISAQQMSGEFSIYKEDASGQRISVGGPWSRVVAAGGTTTVSITEPPNSTSKIIAVFRGQIGSEGSVASGFYAVAGKVTAYSPPPIACGTPISAGGGSSGFQAVMELGTTSGPTPVEFEAYNIPDALEITPDNSTQPKLVTTNGLVSGFHQKSFGHDPAARGTTKVKVTVTGNSDPGTAWTLTVGCPNTTLNNGNRNQPRLQVHWDIGTVVGSAAGECAADIYIDRSFAFRGRMNSSSPNRYTTTLTKGGPHSYEVRNWSCTSQFQGVLGSVYYTDTQGAHRMNGYLPQSGVLTFYVN